MTAEKFYPKDDNLGENCQYWTPRLGCFFPKAELDGRQSCEGVIDDVCVATINDDWPDSMTPSEVLYFSSTRPDEGGKRLPPGSIERKDV